MTATHHTPMRATQHGRAPGGARFADHRGLTAAGAVLVALGAGLVGGGIDIATGEGLRTVFAVFFVLGCAVAAYKVHREDLLAAVVIPPLAYVALAVLANVFSRTTGEGSFLKQQVLELLAVLVMRAPVLLLATGLAAVIALARRAAFRRTD